MNDIVIKQPDPVEHERSGGILVSQANSVVVTSNAEREHAAMFLEEVDSKIKLITQEFNGSENEPGPVTLAHRAWKSGVALRDRALASFKIAKEVITTKVRRFEYDVEQKRVKEARKAQAEAFRKAEEHRKQAIAEAKRIGDRESADNLKEAPIVAAAVAPKTPEVNKVAGIRRSSPMWDWELVSIDKVPRSYLVVDERAVGATVRSLGPKAGIPGISVYDKRERGD